MEGKEWFTQLIRMETICVLLAGQTGRKVNAGLNLLKSREMSKGWHFVLSVAEG